MLKSNLYSG
ncbi:hypothetical protein ECEC4402_4173, partial [Escherichia coli EC4402]